MPVARATNLTRALQAYREAGLGIVGLDGEAQADIGDLEALADPVVLVVGSEGKGLSRLISETCDVRVAIPMSSSLESLNAGVAGGIALYEIARRRGF